MYICMCKGISHNTISKLIDEKRSKEEIIKSTGATTMCGTCKRDFENLFNDRTLV